ncbi:hypothetical protein IGV50_004404 [Salmonella enterica subsp. enterica serovar Newport]|nr:hypothetical protein [Salmonella enterica subsp. enterica serovar Newport]
MEDFNRDELLNSVITSLLELNERVIALEELAVELLSEQSFDKDNFTHYFVSQDNGDLKEIFEVIHVKS